MQLVELQEARGMFEKMELGVAAVTYDNVATLAEFAAAQHVEIPLLADATSRMIRDFGVLDPDNGPENRPDYAMRDMAYPGYFVIDPKGYVREKYFEAIYSDRFTPSNVFGRLFPDLVEKGGARVRAAHLTVAPGQSDLIAGPGNRVSLFADVDIPAGVHVYAPGVDHYKPLDLRLEAPSPFETRPAVYPASKTMTLPAIGEKVPVFEGRVRIAVDVVVPGRDRDFLVSVRDAPGHVKTIEIPGKLLYQACDAKICYPPAEAALAWKLTVRLFRMPPRASPGVQRRS